MQITIPSRTVENVQYGGSSAVLRIYCNRNFFTSDNKPVIKGLVGSKNIYKSVSCTISGTTLTIPQITIDSTTDGLDIVTAKFTAVFYDSEVIRRDIFMSKFAVPHDMGSTLTWAQIRSFNLIVSPSLPVTYYNSAQVNALLLDYRKTTEAISVKSYGATGDGITDDSAAMTAAFADASGRMVVFPPGTYICERVKPPSNTHIYLSKNATIKLIDSALDGSYPIWLDSVSNVTIEGDGAIDGNRDNALRSFGLLITGSTNTKLKDITLKGGHSDIGSFGDGLYLGSPVNTHTLIDGCIFTDNDRNGMQVVSVRDLKVVNCVLKDTSPLDLWLGPSAGFDFEQHPGTTRSVTDAVLSNGDNTVTSNTANFTSADLGKKVIVTIPSGGVFTGLITVINSSTSVEVDKTSLVDALSASMDISPVDTMDDVIVSGCYMYNNDGGGIIVNGRTVADCKNFIISDNIIRDCGGLGIAFQAGFFDGVNIAGNSVSGITFAATGNGEGIRLASSNKGIKCDNNTVYDCEGNGVTIGGCNQFSLGKNRIYNNGQHGVSIRTDTQAGDIGASGKIENNHIFNNGRETPDTYDGIIISGRPDQNVGITILNNDIGNDPNIFYLPTQRYGVSLVDTDVRNVKLLWNTFLGNLSGKINTNTNAQIVPILQLTDYVANSPFSVLFSNSSIDDPANNGSIMNQGVNAPAQITANQNNYANINGKAFLVQLSSDASRDITGIVAGYSGELHLVQNVGSNNIVFKYNSTSSLAANRIENDTFADVTLLPYKSALLYYSNYYYGVYSTTPRWYIILL